MVIHARRGCGDLALATPQFNLLGDAQDTRVAMEAVATQMREHSGPCRENLCGDSGEECSVNDGLERNSKHVNEVSVIMAPRVLRFIAGLVHVDPDVAVGTNYHIGQKNNTARASAEDLGVQPTPNDPEPTDPYRRDVPLERVPLLAVGLSAGSAALVRYLGEAASTTPVCGAVVISPGVLLYLSCTVCVAIWLRDF